jgi:hypothetical protein
MAERTCPICGRSFPPGYRFAQSRCLMCYIYWCRHGSERPRGEGRRPRLPPRPCCICGQLTGLLTRARCPACYQYWWRYGVERPARLWQRRDG